MNGRVITFGESLLRLSPPDHLRWRQAQAFEAFFGGAEANVAVALAGFGVPVQHVTCLPDNDLGLACRQYLRQYGVGTDFIRLSGERLGLYFLEVGSGKRPSRVIYDRAHSSFATMEEDAIAWGPIFSQAGWFHWSGINPAVSAGAARVTANAVDSARKHGLVISCDLNYRHSLWQWGRPPSEIMPELVAQCDLLAANTAYLMLGLPDLPAGQHPGEAGEVCSRLSGRFPKLKHIALTCRETGAAGDQRLTGVLWQAGQLYTSPAFALTQTVDRVGSGDAFMAGLIYGLISLPDDPQRIVDFATACGVIKHSIKGDANLAGRGEIEKWLGTQSGMDIIR
jgi:2-dehydro-3-deoxygluconokinase